MKIFFIENSLIEFDSSDRYSNKLRGGETVLINLAENLALLNNEVHIFNNCNHLKKEINNVYWTDLKYLDDKNFDRTCDVAISQSDANNLKLVNSKKNYFISHSIQTIEKFLRKKQLIPFIKYKPKVIVASNYQNKLRSYPTSFNGKIQLAWSVDKMFYETPLHDGIVEKKAIFTTRPNRNLDKLLDIWKKNIYPQSKSSRLFINPPYKIKSDEKNVFLRSLGNQQNLLNDLKNSRVMLVPGHKGEIFCLAAQEAAEMCVPIVTLGIGSLGERVEHNKTGYIAKNDKEFAYYSISLLNDDKLWKEFRKNLIKKRGNITWKVTANNLNKHLINDQNN